MFRFNLKGFPNYLLFFGALFLCNTNHVIAASCDVSAGHASATFTRYISRSGINDPVNRGMWQFNSTGDSVVRKCEGFYGVDRDNYTYVTVFQLKGPDQNLMSDAEGNLAWKLTTAGQELVTVGMEPFLASSPKSYITADDATPRVLINNSGVYGAIGNSVYFRLGADIVTLSDWAVPDSSIQQGSVNYNFGGEAIIKMRIGGSVDNNASVDIYTPYYDFYFLDNLTINYQIGSCGVYSKQNGVVSWPNLTKKKILDGAVESKPFNLALTCGASTDTPTPINISFSSDQGFTDPAAGIVKTGIDNVGLKLSWANPALPPIVLDQVNRSTLSGIGDYTVLAQVVRTEGGRNVINAGHFDTNVTMNIEFP